MLRISGRASDMRSQAGEGVTLEVRYRVDHAPERTVAIGLRCTEPLCGTRTGAMLDVTPILKHSRPGEWQSLSIPQSCFTAVGADLTRVEVPFAVETSGRLGLTISEQPGAKNRQFAAQMPGNNLTGLERVARREWLI
jgi:beta-glucosidase